MEEVHTKALLKRAQGDEGETAEVKLKDQGRVFCFHGGCRSAAWLVLLVSVHEGNDVDRNVIAGA